MCIRDSTGTERKDTYVLESIASGNPITVHRQPQVEAMAADGIHVNADYDPDAEPFDITGEQAHKRAAVLLTLFDDRDPADVKLAKKHGTYAKPDWSKGEIGVAIAVGSPHAAIKGSEGFLEWGVHLAAPEGEEESPIIDVSAVDGVE